MDPEPEVDAAAAPLWAPRSASPDCAPRGGGWALRPGMPGGVAGGWRAWTSLPRLERAVAGAGPLPWELEAAFQRRTDGCSVGSASRAVGVGDGQPSLLAACPHA